MYSAAATACINSIGATMKKRNNISYREEGKEMEIVRSVSKEKPEISVEIKLPDTVDGVKVRRAVREARIAIRRLTDKKIKIRYKYSAKVF